MSSGMRFFSIEHAKLYGMNEAIFINLIQGWIEHNRANEMNFHDERTWSYNTMEAWCKLLPFFSIDQVRRLIKSLLDQEVLIKGDFNEERMKRTGWYAFKDESKFLAQTPNASGKNTECANSEQLPRKQDKTHKPCIRRKSQMHPAKIPNAPTLESTDLQQHTYKRERDSLPQPPVAVSGSQAFADHFDKTVYSKAISNLFSNPNVEKLFLKTSPLEFETWLKDRHRDVPIIVLEKKFGELADVIEGEPKKYKNIKGAINTYITFGMKDYLQNERTKSFSRGNERRYENARRVSVEDLPF